MSSSINVSNTKINFWTPVKFDKEFLKKKNPVVRAFVDIGYAADSYVYLGKNCLHVKASKEQELKSIDGHVWKTALKVMSYALTVLILPLVLIAKGIYKNWAAKNISSIPPKEKSVESDPKILNKDTQERPQQIHRTLSAKTTESDEYKSAYEDLKKVAEVVLQLGDDNKLSLKNNELVVCLRSPSPFKKDPKNLGKKKSSVDALKSVISQVRIAIQNGIEAVEVKGETLFLSDILKKVEKSHSQFVLNNDDDLKKDFTELQEEAMCVRLEKMTNDLTNFDEALKNLPLPGKTVAEKRLMVLLCMTFPDDFEKVINEHKDASDGIFTNKIFVDNLSVHQTNPSQLVQAMTSLMLDKIAPLYAKSNLIDLFKTLVQCPQYKDELNTYTFKEAVFAFNAAIKRCINDDQNFKKVGKAKSRDLIISYGIGRGLPDPKTVFTEEMMSKIAAAIIKGEKKELKNLANDLAQSFPAFLATYMQDISLEEFKKSYEISIQFFGAASDELAFLIKEKLKIFIDLRKNEQRKEAYNYFIGILLKDSYGLGNYVTIINLASAFDFPEELDAEMLAIKDITSQSFSYKAYRESLASRADKPAIPMIGVITRDFEAELENMKNVNEINSERRLELTNNIREKYVQQLEKYRVQAAHYLQGRLVHS